MLEHLPRSVEQLVEEQAHRWELARGSWRGRPPRRPVVTISRQHGAGGTEVARRLAAELCFDLYDQQILHHIAESAHLSERVVGTLDDRGRDTLTDWLAGFLGNAYLSPVSYRDHLTRVVGTITCHGGAIILGRGAHVIVAPRSALRVFVVAPLAQRVAEIMRREQLGQREARRRIEAVEAERQAFLRKHFHAEFGDPATFDLVVNTGALTADGAVRAVRGALEGLPASAPLATQT
jgi:cytidylate kinase